MTDWTPDRVEELRSLAGKFSAAQIGARMGAIGKSAIIGAAHRYDIALPMLTFWTAERYDELRQLIADKNSAADIAAKWGISRSAIIAGAHRKGIALAWKRGSHGGKSCRPKNLRKPKLRVVEPRAAPATEAEPLRLTFEQLEWGQCRYAVTDELPFLFCGQPGGLNARGDQSPWCSFHHSICHSARPETPHEMAVRKQRYRAQGKVMEAAE